MRPQFRFACADCGESFVVDDVVRQDLLADGCLYCGTGVAPDEFVRLRDATATCRADAD